ncbi:MAG: ribonuclease III [Gammaproteobacteria bacterium]
MIRGIEHRFRDGELLTRALTHRSAHHRHNERLEFLGDAVLGLFVAEVLYARFPHADEGQLTRARATLVNRETLAGIARERNLGEAIALGEGELKSGGWRRDSILANALEALVGAIYLDAGLDAVRVELARWYGERLQVIDPEATEKDAKTRLQEYLQGRQQPLPQYATVDVQGPPHAQTFTVACELLEPALRIEASGRSRRQAEQEAARQVLVALQGRTDQ